MDITPKDITYKICNFIISNNSIILLKQKLINSPCKLATAITKFVTNSYSQFFKRYFHCGVNERGRHYKNRCSHGGTQIHKLYQYAFAHMCGCCILRHLVCRIWNVKLVIKFFLFSIIKFVGRTIFSK